MMSFINYVSINKGDDLLYAHENPQFTVFFNLYPNSLILSLTRATITVLQQALVFCELTQDVNKAMLKIQQRDSPHEGENVWHKL